MKRSSAVAFSCLAMLAMSGCGLITGFSGCKTNALSSFSVTIRDSTTGALIARGATVVWRGPVTDSMTVPATSPGNDSLPVSGPFETEGRFDITVRKPGYQNWTTSVRVTRDDCHVTPVAVTARLKPLT